MTYISSDTNVWIDFQTINRIQLPFLLPYTYLMNNDAIEAELLSPNMKDQLLEAGLQRVEITIEEFFLAEEYGSRYPKLSVHDRIALAIAKERQITLLTGDGALRKAASNENVNCMGTIRLLDELLSTNSISTEEYVFCLEELLRHNGGVVRLPKNELIRRILQHSTLDE